MDKYEFNLKIDQLKKLTEEEDYVTALKIVQSIDWNRVRNTNLLNMAATVYEKNEMLQEAKDMLIMAFERAPVGKHLLFKLTELSCRTGDLEEAEDYYHEFRAIDSTDLSNYLLQYMILKARHAPYEKQLLPLERFCEADPDEKWLYELAATYEYASRIQDCVKTCDKLALLYGDSPYSVKALRLKARYTELTDVQKNILTPRTVPEDRIRHEEPSYDETSFRTEEERYGSEDKGNAETGRQSAGVYEERGPRYSVFDEPVTEDRYVESAEEIAERNADMFRRSDELAATRYRDEDAAFDAYVRAYVSGNGQAAETAAGEGVRASGMDGTDAAEAMPEGDGVQMAFDFGGGEPVVVNEPEAPEESPAAAVGEPAGAGVGVPVTAGTAANAANDVIDFASKAPEIIANAVQTGSPERKMQAAESLLRRAEAAEGISPNAAPDAEPAYKAFEAAREDVGNAPYEAAPAQQPAPYAAPTAPTRQLSASAYQQPSGGTAAMQPQAQPVPATPVQQQAAYVTQAQQPAPAAYTAQASRHFGDRDAAAARAREAAAQAVQPAGAESAQNPAPQGAQTTGTAETVSGLHLIVEAATAQAGLSIAVEELKSIHEEHGIDHASIKTSADKLNQNGISEAVLNRVRGKDFVIEHAGDLNPYNIETIYDFIRSDKAGTIVVLIDTPAGLDNLENQRPELFDLCDYVSDEEEENEKESYDEPEERTPVPVRPIRPAAEDTEDEDEPYDEDAGEEPYEEEKPEKRSKGKAAAERFQNLREITPSSPDHQMEIDEFAQYCAQYAADIDCSISGTSMLALYERIELMEEDGIPLTRTNAEQLIENAADHAEKIRLGRLFRPRYDKNGLLILKEDDFIN